LYTFILAAILDSASLANIFVTFIYSVDYFYIHTVFVIVKDTPNEKLHFQWLSTLSVFGTMYDLSLVESACNPCLILQML